MAKKRRYNAKKIAQTSALKKKLAEVVASHSDDIKRPSVIDMLVYGHRGLISYSEDDLCKLFDKIFEKRSKDFNEKRQKLKELQAKSAHAGALWDVKRVEMELKSLEKEVAELQSLCDEIFENKILI